MARLHGGLRKHALVVEDILVELLVPLCNLVAVEADGDGHLHRTVCAVDHLAILVLDVGRVDGPDDGNRVIPPSHRPHLGLGDGQAFPHRSKRGHQLDERALAVQVADEDVPLDCACKTARKLRHRVPHVLGEHAPLRHGRDQIKDLGRNRNDVDKTFAIREGPWRVQFRYRAIITIVLCIALVGRGQILKVVPEEGEWVCRTRSNNRVQCILKAGPQVDAGEVRLHFRLRERCRRCRHECRELAICGTVLL
mmetsp:Transcript_9039/g.29973  ORF Transcript_9039/g.29973 Transcript_9039/m.29973 type:complete len:252 (+) Transcript_9039:685-1440(+)